jgi:hypothetical protein
MQMLEASFDHLGCLLYLGSAPKGFLQLIGVFVR